MKYLLSIIASLISLSPCAFGFDNASMAPNALEVSVLSQQDPHTFTSACTKQKHYKGFAASQCTLNINCCIGASTNILIKNTGSKNTGPLVNTLTNSTNFEIYPQSSCNEGVVNLAPGQSCLLRLGGHIAPCVGQQSTLTTSANGQPLVIIQMIGVARPCPPGLAL